MYCPRIVLSGQIEARQTKEIEMITVYQIIDIKTGYQIGGDYTNRRRASNRANKLDLEYGAIRYTVKTVSK